MQLRLERMSNPIAIGLANEGITTLLLRKYLIQIVFIQIFLPPGLPVHHQAVL